MCVCVCVYNYPRLFSSRVHAIINCNMNAIVKWNHNFGNVFPVTVGTRQGCVLSPKLFNIFIDVLLIQLRHSSYGLRIGKDLHNCFAYAKDISLFASTVPQLQ